MGGRRKGKTENKTDRRRGRVRALDRDKQTRQIRRAPRARKRHEVGNTAAHGSCDTGAGGNALRDVRQGKRSRFATAGVVDVKQTGRAITHQSGPTAELDHYWHCDVLPRWDHAYAAVQPLALVVQPRPIELAR